MRAWVCLADYAPDIRRPRVAFGSQAPTPYRHLSNPQIAPLTTLASSLERPAYRPLTATTIPRKPTQTENPQCFADTGVYYYKDRSKMAAC